MLVDYATRYPEALPFRAATAKAVAKELMLLFSRVGIAREVLTDQGTFFMSRVMKELLSLLPVKQFRTSDYDPQTDGLVERFNKTLKQSGKCPNPPRVSPPSSCYTGEDQGDSSTSPMKRGRVGHPPIAPWWTTWSR